ncbi:uncharacterized protein si:ch73-345f18.3 isoform X1 [Micropterus dolomieu]|uniref:uncharacterized protein si:ch73-345f18.3 isoform X1 n=1 Tax=Micropterus dolomieu TaxID=147949 RepID=UPI001E8D0E96|nr:uncharacterized protein si:ch73-345f18.3 isoform X1 [Micropterus dolomieu]XP_045914226.1 uncharacterized protein si:ch73-345f18.3 isoform X1 [Micropterus dolomieu]
MLRFLCCCCFSGENSGNERQPLLHPGPFDLNSAGSARQNRPAHSNVHTVKRKGRLVMRRVCVPELDQRFSDMAEAFNEQQERYEAMVRHIRNLRQTYGCNHDDSLALAECLGTIRDEHEAQYRVSLKIKGYDFSLNVVPVGSQGESEEEPLPPHLQLAQDEVKGTSESAKATISKGTTLQELIGWLLRSKGQMAEQVKEVAATYQEQGRLTQNLEENIKEVKRAKDLSMRYRHQAGEVLTEVAQIAGALL